MRSQVELLFEEFAASWARGEHPDARDYLDRAGNEREELATLLDGFIAAAPVRPPSAETLATFALLVPGQPPLFAERVRRGWTRGEVVDWIRKRFGIAEAKRLKVDAYWHELETGLRPADQVSSGLAAALLERFGAAWKAALDWRPSPPKPADADVAYRRVADDSWRATSMPAPAARASIAEESEPPEPDEVDRLFTGGA